MSVAFGSTTLGGYDQARPRELLSAAAASRIGVGLLALFVFFNDANFRTLVAEESRFDWQIMLRLAICGACGLYGLLFLPQTQRYLLRMPAAWFTLFVGWGVLTAICGVNFIYSLAAVCSLGCVVLFGPALLGNVSRNAILRTCMWMLTLYLLGCWFTFYFVPSLGRDPYLASAMGGTLRLGGLHQPNGTGRQAALLIGVCLAMLHTGAARWKWMWPILLLAGVTLVATGSRTAMLSVAAVSGLFLLRHVRPSRVIAIAAAAGLAVCLVVAAWGAGAFRVNSDAIAESAARDGESEEATTLAGRTFLWEFTLRKTLDSPVVGFGYSCSRFVIVEGYDWPTFHAHNLLLDVTLCNGLMGGALILATLLGLGIAAMRRPSMFPDLILLLVVVAGVADLVMLTPIPNPYTLLFVLALFWREFQSPQTNDSSSDHSFSHETATSRI
jgi:O-antigen ligase